MTSPLLIAVSAHEVLAPYMEKINLYAYMYFQLLPSALYPIGTDIK